MAKNAILEDLQKSKQKRHDEVELKEIKGLLVADTSRDLEVYRAMGISSQFEQKIDEEAKVVNEKRIAEEFGSSDVVHLDDIKKVAIKYNLRLLPTACYNGYVETGLAKEVQEFCEKNNLIVDNAVREMYILAREEDFNLEDRPIPPEPPKDLDPILFYRTSTSGWEDRNYYKMVSKWGNDLSPSRAISAWKYKNNSTVYIHTCFKWFIYIYTFLTALSFLFINGFDAFSWSRLITSIVISAIISYLAITDVDEWETVDGITTEEMWDNKEKRNRKWYR